MAKDFSEYEMSEAEKYRQLRANDASVSFDYFNNSVSFELNKHMIHISVDPSKEFIRMFDDIEDDEWITSGGHPRPTARDEEEARSFEELRASKREENEQYLAAFQANYSIEREDFFGEEQVFYEFHPDQPREPLNNVLSGAEITLALGEGLLDFVYTNFETPFKKVIVVPYFFRHVTREKWDKITGRTPPSSTEKAEKKEHIQKIIRRSQLRTEQYFRFNSSMCAAGELVYASLYTAICPPVFSSEQETYSDLRRYFRYITILQKEYLALLEFCFDEEFSPNILGKQSPAARYALFRHIHHQPMGMDRKEHIYFPRLRKLDKKSTRGEDVPDTYSPKDAVPSLDEIEEFAERYGMLSNVLSFFLQFPAQMIPEYEFHSLADLLTLEFGKMLEAGIKIRKCKRCGKYFLMKGNYDTQYCGRIAPGETRKCNELAAQENYRKKAENNQALNIYSKYYRRYSARLKVNQIKEDEFKRWRYAAILKRNECTDGVITVEELIDWMEAYFPNRQRKK